MDLCEMLFHGSFVCRRREVCALDAVVFSASIAIAKPRSFVSGQLAVAVLAGTSWKSLGASVSQARVGSLRCARSVVVALSTVEARVVSADRAEHHQTVASFLENVFTVRGRTVAESLTVASQKLDLQLGKQLLEFDLREQTEDVIKSNRFAARAEEFFAVHLFLEVVLQAEFAECMAAVQKSESNPRWLIAQLTFFGGCTVSIPSFRPVHDF